MVRIAVIADIHGNLPALEAVIADIERRAVDRTINLGDCVSGPMWPREVCELLDITAANQRVLLHRGRAAIRQVLEDYVREPA